MKVKIHHEGTQIIILAAVVLLLVNLPLWLWVRPMAIAGVVSFLSAVLFGFIVNFFRSPRRHFAGSSRNLVVSSADGTVVAIEEVYEPEYLKCDCIQLSVFMSILNVHANWFPVNGEVVEVRHFPGRFMSAYLPKSSTENEHSSVLIHTAAGPLVVVNQVAGAVARRIVTYAEPGEECTIEEHMGFIKFGSRVDIFLPLDTEVLVKIGDKTTGGITPIARLKSKSSDKK